MLPCCKYTVALPTRSRPDGVRRQVVGPGARSQPVFGGMVRAQRVGPHGHHSLCARNRKPHLDSRHPSSYCLTPSLNPGTSSRTSLAPARCGWAPSSTIFQPEVPRRWTRSLRAGAHADRTRVCRPCAHADRTCVPSSRPKPIDSFTLCSLGGRPFDPLRLDYGSTYASKFERIKGDRLIITTVRAGVVPPP